MYNLVPLSDGIPICKNNLPINNISYIAGSQGVVVLFLDRYAVRSQIAALSERYAVRLQHDLNVT